MGEVSLSGRENAQDSGSHLQCCKGKTNKWKWGPWQRKRPWSWYLQQPKLKQTLRAKLSKTKGIAAQSTSRAIYFNSRRYTKPNTSCSQAPWCAWGNSTPMNIWDIRNPPTEIHLLSKYRTRNGKVNRTGKRRANHELKKEKRRYHRKTRLR